MSFKRDGDDKSLLSVLRKRRVSELFAENIPDNEAQILSNGKLTCTVCHYKPVFDTIQVLAQHRSGKKHLENAKRAKEKNEELQKLIEIRQQNGSTVLPVISKTSASLLTSAPYEARVMKSKLKSHERKPTINLSNVSTNEKMYLGAAKVPFCFLKNSSTDKTESLKPYAKVRQSNSEHVERIQSKAELDNFNTSLAKMKCSKLNSISNSSADDKLSLTHILENSTPKVPDTQKKELAYKYWQLAGSGWRKDWTGKWEKDEEAEFDSDEEPPDLP